MCGREGSVGEENKRYKCYDPESGKLNYIFNVPFDRTVVRGIKKGHFLTFDPQSGKKLLQSSQEICPETISSVDCNCNSKKKENSEIKLDSLKKITLATICSKEYAEEDWKNFLPESAEKIDEATALLYLKKFSKAKGFDVSKDTGKIVGMLEAGLHVKYPGQFKAAMIGVISSSDVLYESLKKKYVGLAKLEDYDSSCLTDSEKENNSKTIYNYIKGRLSYTQRSFYEDVEPYLKIAKHALNKEHAESLIEFTADRLVEAAGD